MIKFCRKQLKLDQNFKVIIVCNIPSPHLDVNLTNYTTLVNFYMTVEGLSQNLLSLVVANERTDLDSDFNTAMDTTFGAVKQLKEVENNLLKQLGDQSVDQVLANEEALNLLHESATTSEVISNNLRKIKQTNEFLDKTRAIYTPVAFRAATLYYGILDLGKLNPMYKFGLQWFLT
jgi:dynein heavy chain